MHQNVFTWNEPSHLIMNQNVTTWWIQSEVWSTLARARKTKEIFIWKNVTMTKRLHKIHINKTKYLFRRGLLVWSKLPFQRWCLCFISFVKAKLFWKIFFSKGKFREKRKHSNLRQESKGSFRQNISALLIKVKWCEDNTWQGAITTGKSENSSRPGTKNFTQKESLPTWKCIFEIGAVKF